MPPTLPPSRFNLRLRAMVRTATGLVYSPVCALCDAPVNRDTPHALCADCWQTLPFMPSHHCNVCSQPLQVPSVENHAAPQTICLTCQHRPIVTDAIVAPFLYREPLVKLILKLKYADDLALSQFFVHHLLSALTPIIENHKPSDFLLLPVPSHFTKTLRRKYNQAEVLARALSRLSNIAMVSNLLQRIEPTSQKNIGADARFRQLKTAFALNKKIWPTYRQKHIILVDDVVTTCATMHHLSVLLKKHHAGFVGGVAIARTPLQF
ncbi:MAG: ComF family protein [Hydrotalea sp.]|nr:ComF family protein [Hydrotalea sp.]